MGPKLFQLVRLVISFFKDLYQLVALTFERLRQRFITSSLHFAFRLLASFLALIAFGLGIYLALPTPKDVEVVLALLGLIGSYGQLLLSAPSFLRLDKEDRRRLFMGLFHAALGFFLLFLLGFTFLGSAYALFQSDEGSSGGDSSTYQLIQEQKESTPLILLEFMLQPIFFATLVLAFALSMVVVYVYSSDSPLGKRYRRTLITLLIVTLALIVYLLRSNLHSTANGVLTLMSLILLALVLIPPYYVGSSMILSVLNKHWPPNGSSPPEGKE